LRRPESPSRLQLRGTFAVSATRSAAETAWCCTSEWKWGWQTGLRCGRLSLGSRRQQSKPLGNPGFARVAAVRNGGQRNDETWPYSHRRSLSAFPVRLRRKLGWRCHGGRLGHGHGRHRRLRHGGAGGPSLTVDDFRSPNAAVIWTAARGAANSTPRFGSVTQSSNTDSQGVTTDGVESSPVFLGLGNLYLTIERQGLGDIDF